MCLLPGVIGLGAFVPYRSRVVWCRQSRLGFADLGEDVVDAGRPDEECRVDVAPIDVGEDPGVEFSDAVDGQAAQLTSVVCLPLSAVVCCCLPLSAVI